MAYFESYEGDRALERVEYAGVYVLELYAEVKGVLYKDELGIGGFSINGFSIAESARFILALAVRALTIGPVYAVVALANGVRPVAGRVGLAAAAASRG